MVHSKCFIARSLAELMLGPYPQYGWDFPEEIPETFRKREFPSRVRLGSSKPYNSRHLKLPEHFQESRIVSPQCSWGCLFLQKWFRRPPLRAGHGIPSSTEGISECLHPAKRKRRLFKIQIEAEGGQAMKRPQGFFVGGPILLHIRQSLTIQGV